MPFVPVHEAHAVDRVAATISFGVPPLVSSPAWLSVLKEAIQVAEQIGFDQFQEGIGTSFSVFNAPGVLTEARTQVFSSGSGFKLTDEENKTLAEFMAFRHEIRIDSHAYVRWSGFRELLQSIIPRLLRAYPTEYMISQIKLEYWDRFQSPDQRSPWSELFRSTDRLPSWPLSRDDNWHAYLGWFEDLPGGRRRLVNLHVDAIDQVGLAKPIQTAAIYTLTTTVGEELQITAPESLIFERFEELHDASKQAVGEVLTPQMAERISLFKKAEEV